VTLTGSDALILVCLGLLVCAGWFLAITGLALVEWEVYGLILAAGVQLFFHTGTLTDTGPVLLVAGFVLAAAGIGVQGLTIYRWSRLVAAGRFNEIHWRAVAALSLWVAGAGAMMTVVHPVFGVVVITAVVVWVWLVLRPEAREIRMHVTIEIGCDPDAAFSVVGDPRQAPSYIENFEIASAPNEPVGVGYRYTWRFRRSGGHVFEDEDEVVDFRPGQLIKTRSLRHRPAAGSCLVERAPAGSRVIYDFEGKLSIAQALLGERPTVVSRLTRFRERICGRLKQVMESLPDNGASLKPAG
jgi:polyketide cyclase/dehydrase/lipid transport protein